MAIPRFFLGLLATVAGALAGNWIGGQIRFLLTGEAVQSIHFEYTTTNGIKMDSCPVNTKFIPGLLFALLGNPRWLFALLGGTLASLFVDDKYEEIWLERVIVPMIIKPESL